MEERIDGLRFPEAFLKSRRGFVGSLLIFGFLLFVLGYPLQNYKEDFSEEFESLDSLRSIMDVDIEKIVQEKLMENNSMEEIQKAVDFSLKKYFLERDKDERIEFSPESYASTGNWKIIVFEEPLTHIKYKQAEFICCISAKLKARGYEADFVLPKGFFVEATQS